MKLKVQGSSLNWQVGNMYAKAAAKVSLKQPCGSQLSAQVCAESPGGGASRALFSLPWCPRDDIYVV